MADDVLDRICRDLASRGAHTILLYGSRADGSANLHSDYDVAAFAPVERTRRDTRVVDGCFLDVFVHPDDVLARPATADVLPLRGSLILMQRNDDATRFLASLDELHRRGPERLPDDEIRARDAWARKMALRARRGDVEGDYRRAWLLTALLDDYFVTRGRWFEGPKKSLEWLRVNVPALHHAFEVALRPGASAESIDELVDRATSRSR